VKGISPIVSELLFLALACPEKRTIVLRRKITAVVNIYLPSYLLTPPPPALLVATQLFYNFLDKFTFIRR
jgi:hypothetical protein